MKPLPYTSKASDIAEAIRQLVKEQCEVLTLTALLDVTAEFINRADEEDRDECLNTSVEFLKQDVLYKE